MLPFSQHVRWRYGERTPYGCRIWLSVPLLSPALGWVIIYADRLGISPLLNLILHGFNLSISAVSLLLAVYFFTHVLFTIPTMLVAGKFGSKRTMILFLVVAAGDFGVAGVAGTTYYSLLVLLGTDRG